MELKTSKELKVSSENPMFNMGADTQFDALKKEADKWIEFLSKPVEMDLRFAVMYRIKGFQKEWLEKKWTDGNKEAISWIKYFFNISEEEI